MRKRRTCLQTRDIRGEIKKLSRDPRQAYRQLKIRRLTIGKPASSPGVVLEKRKKKKHEEKEGKKTQTLPFTYTRSFLCTKKKISIGASLSSM